MKSPSGFKQVQYVYNIKRCQGRVTIVLKHAPCFLVPPVSVNEMENVVLLADSGNW